MSNTTKPSSPQGGATRSRAVRSTRKPVTVQETEHTIRRVAADARAVAVVLDSFLTACDLPDGVAVSLSLRSRSLLMEAVDHLEAALDRLESK